MVSAPDDAWKRLGVLLVQRRIDLAPRYRDRTRFAEDVGLNWRLLHDIERHKRANFTDETLAAVEVAYRWRAGSIASVLAGGDPEPADDPQQRRPSGFSEKDERTIRDFAEFLRRRGTESNGDHDERAGNDA